MLKINSKELITADEIEPAGIDWLWYPYIPYGKVTLLQGDPGDGKSTFMLSIAALLSNGEPPPFSNEALSEPIKTIYQTTEDDLADTVVPRFINAGGNCSNLFFINESKMPLSFCDQRIANAVKEIGAKLLILDPLSSYIGSNCTLNNANEVRAQFNHLIETAKTTGCAVVIIAHLNKMPGLKAIYRTTGSIDVVGAARSALLIAREKPDSSERIMVQQKSNLAPTGYGIRFAVDEDGIDFIEQVNLTADELLGNYISSLGRPDDEFQSCMEFIKKMLADGPLPAGQCLDRLKAAGHRERTAKKAKRDLNVESTRNGEVWVWSLPS